MVLEVKKEGSMGEFNVKSVQKGAVRVLWGTMVPEVVCGKDLRWK